MPRPPPPGPLAALAAVVDRFPRVEVVVAGDYVADEYVYGETERISREAPVLIVRFERSELRPGCAGNAALNLAALGVRVRAVGVVGDDAMGEALLAALRAGRIEVSGLLRVRGRPTESKTRILAGGRSTRRQQMLRVDRAPAGALPRSLQDRLARALARQARGAQAVLASDYGSDALAHAAIEELRRVAARGVPVCVDSRYRLPAFRGLTMCKPNEPELEAAVGSSVKEERALERAARRLQRRLSCDQLLVTRGRNGMSLFRAGRPVLHLPVHGSEEAVDVTGAGDAVAAAYCASLAAGASPEEATRIANVAGALAVRKPGTATASRRELLDAIGGG
jgi:rfaE bifunctional protein kinase chain/domain